MPAVYRGSSSSQVIVSRAGFSIIDRSHPVSPAGAVKPASTMLYVIDQALDTLYVQNPPNNGTLTTPVKINTDLGNDVGFDIAGTANSAYVTNAGAEATTLYRLDLASGQVTKVGEVATVTKKGKLKRTSLIGLAAVQD